MQVVSVEELINIKILPFDIYNQNGNKILSEGEILTPGKLLQLRYLPVLYKQDDDIEDYEEEEVVPTPILPESEPDLSFYEAKYRDGLLSKSFNKRGISSRSQNIIQKLYSEAIANAVEEDGEKDIFFDIRDKIVQETLPLVDKIVYKSELKINGNYDDVHSINVAILSAALAAKLKFNEAQIKDITLAALLHDVGKIRLPKELLNKESFTVKETRLLHLHPQIGYRIIRKELGFPEHIAKVALEHHEKNDGSGYPFGISSGLISLLSQVIIVCNVYDEIMANKSTIKVKDAKEAIKAMLSIGSKSFTPNILYTFVYMSNYNDTTLVDGYIG